MPLHDVPALPPVPAGVIARCQSLSPCALADALPRSAVFAAGISSLWQPAPRIAGQAFTVHCPAGDNLMLHAAIHRAPKGSIIVVQSDAPHFALAGGNVAMVAQRRGIAGFILDGVMRDVAEVRDAKFPVFARGVMPKPASKERLTPLASAITCAGVTVNYGDIIAADEEGIVVIPCADVDQVLAKAEKKAAKEAAQSLEDWRGAHQQKIAKLLAELGN